MILDRKIKAEDAGQKKIFDRKIKGFEIG